MKLKTYFNATLLCLATSLFAACAGDNLADSDNNKGKQPIEEVKGVHFSIDSPKASAKLRVTLNEDGTTVTAKTRTIIKHTVGNGADAYWSDNDKLWVKDKNGNWKQSIATYVYDEGRRATFIMPGSANDYNDNCQVAYCSADLTDFSVSMFAPDGIGNGYPVTHISYEQNQTTPNDFSKAGEWGDCGVGTAKKKTNKFDFTLDHSAAYLCLLPRCENATLGQNIELTNIQIKADNPMQLADIASNIFELHDDGTIHYPNDNPGGYGSPSSMITATVANFPLTNTTTSLETNACYFVLRPALHDFTITYTIKDKVTGIETEIKKQVNGVDCKAGEINDIPAWIDKDIKNQTQPKYYEPWAAEDYWYGHLKADGTPDGNYPDVGDSYRSAGSGTPNAVFNDIPNINELVWYIKHGDAHWGKVLVAKNNSHLDFVTGIWLKKKAKIMVDQSVTEAEMKAGYPKVSPHDYTNDISDSYGIQNTVSSAPLTDKSDYFFLPAFGTYASGVLQGYGTTGQYVVAPVIAYSVSQCAILYFDKTTIKVSSSPVDAYVVANGFSVSRFE